MRKNWETHKEYIDIQYVVSGKERIWYTDKNNLKICNGYDVEKDFTLYEGSSGNGICLNKGYFCILFPDDAHKPGCELDGKQTIKKVVVKVKA